ncbi:serine hydrolase domain-containing protein [Flavihumibacter cheonanensis]|uniref:serine hydrolase domain-containing protein n=1 Tax=Flavihumibacter cheonanensis TaxID=1442385 RepID=UPI001EF7E889|nr:serine hydrolase domain-containing protein [Flavihumibacter cheonanensis]MCG7754341.1 beta-lactamase family protein [Flavihumibacter cheonanensis]
MTRTIILIAAWLLLLSKNADAQSDRQQIQELLQTFMKALKDKDSLTMYSLFINSPVTWVRVWKPTTLEARRKQNPNEKELAESDHKSWFRRVMQGGIKEEYFLNPVIAEDGSIGSVTFDYSFWSNGVKGNWGKESWALVKENGKWKIASVIFSVELEKIVPQKEGVFSDKPVLHPKMDAYLKALVDTGRFQGVVLVAKGDSLLHHQAYGKFDWSTGSSNQLGTQFLIGSLTKSVVAVAIMQLVEKGKISLNAPIKQYLPELKNSIADGVTVHHLLKQQSGLNQFIEDCTEIEVMDISSPELITIINKARRAFEPGKKFAYSNLNYNLLGILIERVTGLSYTDYMQQKVFAPLGLQATGIERLSNIPTNKAVGYRTMNGIFRPIQNVTSYALGTGDIYSTAADLFTWGQALHKGLLVSDESRRQLFNGGDKDWGYYGYGFRIQPYQRASGIKNAGTLIRHGGTMNGYISNYHYYKEDELTVILLCNNRDIPIRRITYILKEIAMGEHSSNRINKHLE